MNNNHVYDMLVVGGGPGGYTAALYAARAGLDTIVLEKLSAGGQMALTEQIDNYPGFENGIDGFSLAEKMQKQAERFGDQGQSVQDEGRWQGQEQVRSRRIAPVSHNTRRGRFSAKYGEAAPFVSTMDCTHVVRTKQGGLTWRIKPRM